jgi:predicted  nucleic acid-binding Zn-ribbon protein
MSVMIIDDLLALPRRALVALDAVTDALRRLAPLETAVNGAGDDVRAIRDVIEPAGHRIEKIHAAIDRLHGEVSSVQGNVEELRKQVQDMAGLVPGSREPGPLERAKDALTPG